MTMHKVLVVGLDGATFGLIEPWVQAGELPTFARLLREGAHGILQSTMQPLSPPAWVSFRTGVNPGKHGVFGFQTFRIDKPLTPAPFRSVPHPSFWEILSEQREAKVCVVNVPCTFPARPVRGRMIAGFPVVGNVESLAHPAGLIAEIEEHVGPYRIDLRNNLGGDLAASHDEFVRELTEVVESRAQTARYLLSRYPWDLGVIVFTAPDRVQNVYWQYADRHDPRPTDAERARFGDVVLRIYQMLDGFLGQALEYLGQEGLLLIMSDHGFGPMFEDVNLSRWLAQEGFLVPSRGVSSQVARLKRRARSVLRPLVPQAVIEATRGVRQGGRGSGTSPSLADQMLVDWTRTRAFELGRFGNVVVNLEGREPYGIVSPGQEYEAVRAAITERLRAWRHPVTGKRLIRQVYRREDLYEGPFVDQAPDLLLEWEDYGYFGFRPASPHDPMWMSPVSDSYKHLGWSGNHRPEGILMAWGHGVPPGHVVEGAHVQDLAPTILHYMMGRVPAHMDGRVLPVFDRQFADAHPVHVEAIASRDQAQDESALTDAERRGLEDHLKALGYL